MAIPENCVENTIALLKNVVSTFPHLGSINLSEHKIPLRRKFRDLNSGDIVLPTFIRLESCKKDELLQFIQTAINQNDIPVSKVVSNSHNLLAFFLKRHQIIKEILTEVHAKEAKYGTSELGKGQMVCFNPVSSLREDCPTEYRSSVVMTHTANLLRANGYDVHFVDEYVQFRGLKDKHQRVEETIGQAQDTPSRTHDTPSCTLDSAATRLCQFESKVQEILDDEATQQGHFVQMERILAKHQFIVGKEGIDRNIHQLKVFDTDGQATDILKDAANLEEKLDLIMKSKDTVYRCVHVVPQQKAFRQQQVLLLNVVLSDKNFHQSLLTVGPVMCEDESSMEDIYRTRYDQMKQSSELRYGHKCEGSKWETQFQVLAKASLTFELLGTASHSPLYTDLEASTLSESRLGSFVLYNAARLASLLQHFSQEVEKGTYPPLPAIETVDFTLLREQEDWELAFLFISYYPEIVRETVEAIKSQQGHILAKIHTHKVIIFLTNFSKALSSYYSRYHILGERESHLLPLMYARLYLMRAAHQVLVSALQLLDISALDQI